MKKVLAFLLVVTIALFCSAAFAQSGTNGSSSTSTSTSTSNAGVTNNNTVVVDPNAGNNGRGRQAISAPGGSNGPIGPVAAYMPQFEGVLPYVALIPGSFMTLTQLENCARDVKFDDKPDLEISDRVPGDAPKIIRFINWNPEFFTAYRYDERTGEGDQIFATNRQRGLKGSNYLKAACAVVLAAQKGSNSSRCFAGVRSDLLIRANGKAGGIGGAFSRMSGILPLGADVGLSTGNNTTREFDQPDVSAACMNDGPAIYSPPPLPSPPEPKPATVELKVIAPPAPALAPAPAIAAATTTTDLCSGLPTFAIHFDLNKFELKDTIYDRGGVVHEGNLLGIDVLGKFLVQNPGCQVVLEGRASREYTLPYNVDLGRKRAEHVLDWLIARYPQVRPSVCKYVSLGKELATDGHNNELIYDDREVVAVPRQPTSDPSTDRCLPRR